MRILVTAIVTAIAVSALWILTLRYRPTWIAKIMFDADGFPRVRTKGDRFILQGKTYYFDGNIWIELGTTGFPVAPAPKEGDTFIVNGVGYKFSNGNWVVITGPDETSSSRVIISSDPTRQKCMKHVGFNDIWYTYNGLLTSYSACVEAGRL